jgi:uncharacterized protein (DUF1697 family)
MTGHNSIRMTDLAALFHDLGFIRAETYIQSGNVIFSSDKDTPVAEISLAVENAIFERFGYVVPVIIKTISEMKNVISSNPFLSEKNFNPSKVSVMFLREKISESQIQKVADIDYPPDKFKIIGNEIYTFCPNGFGKTKLYTNFFENKMKVTGTARNWNTITTILNLAELRM